MGKFPVTGLFSQPWRTAAWVAAVIAAIAGVIAWSSHSSVNRHEARALAPVTRGDIEDTVSALGIVQPRDFVDVGAQVSGQLKQVLVTPGEQVEQGTLVAEIDAAVLAARVEAGRATLTGLSAQLEERRAQHTLAAQQHKRNVAMLKEDAVSRSAVDTSLAASKVAEAQLQATSAQIAQTRANLKADQASLAYAKIYAPMSGTVVTLNARQGQTLNASQQAPVLLRIANLETMTVVTQVSEADVVRLKPGIPVYFSTLGLPDRRWKGVVRQILPTPETVNNVVLYNVLFDVANPDRELKAQMSAQVFFVLARAKDALLVPVSALKKSKQKSVSSSAPSAEVAAADTPATTNADAATVKKEKKGKKEKKSATSDGETIATPRYSEESWVVHVMKDNQVDVRPVAVGVTNRLMAQVLSGLNEGEQVAVEPDVPEKRSVPSKDAARRPAKL